MKPSTAEYWLLKEVSNLDTFGQEMFHNTKFGYNGVSMIGVGPHGITVYRNRDEETQKYVLKLKFLANSIEIGESNKRVFEKRTGIYSLNIKGTACSRLFGYLYFLLLA